MKTKNKIFLDSNIFIAGLASETGASAEIIRLVGTGELKATICRLIIEESQRNFKKKLPSKLEYYYLALEKMPLEIIPQIRTGNSELKRLFPKYTDQIIFETCQKVAPDYFISLNRKHFHNDKVKKIAKFKIVTPGDFLKIWRRQ